MRNGKQIGQENGDGQFLVYLAFVTIQLATDIGYLVTDSHQLIVNIIKLCLDGGFVITLLLMKSKPNMFHCWIIIYLNRIATLFFCFFAHGAEAELIILYISINIQLYQLNSHQKKLDILFQLGIVIGVIVIHQDQIKIVIIVSYLLMRSLVHYYIQQEQQFIYQMPSTYLDLQPTSTLRKSFSVKELTHSKDALFNRIKDIPFLAIIVSKSQLTITQINSSLRSILEDRFNEEQALSNFLLNTLKFQIMKKQPTEDKIRNKRQTIFNINEQPELIEEQMTLKSVIQFRIRYPQKSNLEIFCHHSWDEASQLVLAGQIQFTLNDDNILIILNDISKQIELHQQVIKNDFKSKIVESFSHEMRTPLNSAINFISSALSENGLSEEIKSTLLAPALNSLRLQTYLINDIVDFSEYYAGDLKIQSREFTFPELVNDISNLFKLQFELKGMGFLIDMSKNPLRTFTTDYTRFLQIIVNLLQNAIKFSIDGLVVLKIKKVENNLKISVKDEGNGLDEEKLKEMQKVLKEMSINKDFAMQRQWRGFGFLNSTLLLSKMAPKNLQNISIKSQGSFQGMKVTFYIENQKDISPIYQARTFHRIQSLSSKPQQDINSWIEVTRKKVQGNMNMNTNTSPNKLNQSADYISNVLASQECKAYCQIDKLINTPKLMSQLNSSERRELANDLDLNLHYSLGEQIFSDQKSIDLNQKNSINLQQKNSTNLHRKDQISIQFERKQIDVKSSLSFKNKTLNINQLLQISEQESQQYLDSFTNKCKQICSCKKILSVDDEVFNQYSVKALLKQNGFEVVLAFNGAQAIETIKDHHKCSTNCHLFSVILMDYQMPIMDGIQTTKMLRKMMSQQQIPYIPIIGLTAFTAATEVQACLDSGMTHVLAKPLNFQEFKEVLAQL